MKNLFLSLVLIFFIGNSCNNKPLTDKDISFNVRDTLVFRSNDKINMPVSKRSIVINNDTNNSSELLYFWSTNGEISGYEIETEGKSELKPVFENNSLNNFYFFQILFYSPDSIIAFSNDNQTIYLFDSSGKVLNEYLVHNDYTPVAVPGHSINGFYNNLIFSHTSKTISVSVKENRKQYYKTVSPILLVQLDNGAISGIKKIGKYPENYIETGSNYNNFLSQLCMNEDLEVVCSFSADDYIYVYNIDDGKYIQRLAKSKYIDHFTPYPDDKNLDMLFLKRYKSEEPKYTDIIYNPYKKRYYRIAKHRSNQSEVKRNSELERFWSVIIFDSLFNNIGEHRFNYKEYLPQVFIPTREGILVYNSHLQLKNENNFALSIIYFE